MNALNQREMEEKQIPMAMFSEAEGEFFEMKQVLENGLKNLRQSQVTQAENQSFETFLLAKSVLLLQESNRKVLRTKAKIELHFSLINSLISFYKWLVFNLFDHGMRESLATWQVR